MKSKQGALSAEGSLVCVLTSWSSNTAPLLFSFFLGPSHTRRPSVGFSNGSWTAIQDSAATPSVRGLCRSAARSYLCCFVSETRAAWNRADTIFDAWRLVLTNQSKRGGRATLSHWNYRSCLVTEKLLEPMGPLYHNGTTGAAWLQKNYWNLWVLQWRWGHCIAVELVSTV